MSVTELPHAPEDVARLGAEILDRRLGPLLKPEDDGKFVAIDIKTCEHEIDKDDYTAIMRLRTRLPSAEIWLGRIGQPAAYRIRRYL